MLENRSPVTLTGILLTPVFVDAAGNVTRQEKQRDLRSMTLPFGQRVSVDIGLGSLTDAELQAIRLRIDSAKVAEAAP